MPPGIIRFIVAAKDTGNKDFNTDADQDSKVNRRDNISGELVGDMTYDEWKAAKKGLHTYDESAIINIKQTRRKTVPDGHEMADMTSQMILSGGLP